jgi:hypothetical protein
MLKTNNFKLFEEKGIKEIPAPFEAIDIRILLFLFENEGKYFCMSKIIHALRISAKYPIIRKSLMKLSSLQLVDTKDAYRRGCYRYTITRQGTRAAKFILQNCREQEAAAHIPRACASCSLRS